MNKSSNVVWHHATASWFRCEALFDQRSVLYRRARAGKVTAFTGISSPYEEPPDPELVVDTAKLTLDESVGAVIGLLRTRGIVTSRP